MTDKKKEAEKAETDAWMPTDPGETLEGVVVDLDTAWSDWRARQYKNDPDGGNYPLISVKTDDGEIVKVHCFRTVLFNEVMKRQPMPGEKVAITYVGEGKTPDDGGNAPIIYRLHVVGRDPEKVAASVYGNMPGRNQQQSVPQSDVPADTDGLKQEEIPF